MFNYRLFLTLFSGNPQFVCGQTASPDTRCPWPLDHFRISILLIFTSFSFSLSLRLLFYISTFSVLNFAQRPRDSGLGIHGLKSLPEDSFSGFLRPEKMHRSQMGLNPLLLFFYYYYHCYHYYYYNYAAY